MTARPIVLASPYRGQQLMWAAGFLEGEGSFTGAAGTQHVRAPQTTTEPLERLAALFGGRVARVSKGKHDGRHRAIYQWEITGARARGVMLTLYASLSSRRQQQICRAMAVGDLSPGWRTRRSRKAWVSRLERYGPCGRRAKASWRTQDRDSILALIRQGYGCRRIGKALGIPRSTAHYIITRLREES